jgi:hypothetical protein
MIHRAATARLTQLLGQFPAVALLGPRQVGKTTLALSLTGDADSSPLYVDLELPSDRTISLRSCALPPSAIPLISKVRWLNVCPEKNFTISSGPNR